MNSKFLVNFFLFCLAISSFMPVRGMEEKILSKNPANKSLLKQKITKYLSRRKKYLKYEDSSDNTNRFQRFEEIVGCYKPNEEKLLEALKKNCNYVNQFIGLSPLIRVIQTTGSSLQVKMLLLAGAHVDGERSKLKNMPERYKRSSLHTALAFRLPKIVKLLIKDGANPNVQTENGETPLHIAVLEGYVGLVGWLLEKGADSEVKNNYDESPLDYAYKCNGKKEIISLLKKHDNYVDQDREQLGSKALLRKKIQELIDYKKNLSERDRRKFFENDIYFSQYLRLGKCIEKASVEEICKGLDRGISVIDGNPSVGLWFDPCNNSFLNFVIKKCSVHSVNLFVELMLLAGVEANGKRKTENFAYFHSLNQALRFRKFDTIPLLLRFGANPSFKNKNVDPPLIYAVKENLYSVVKLFLEKGVDPNCVNKMGATCLHAAVQNGNHLMVKLLLKHGAISNNEDNHNHGPIDYAYMFNDEKIIEIFEKWSSDKISVKNIKKKTEIQRINALNKAKDDLARYIKINRQKHVESDWFENYKPKSLKNALPLKNKINEYLKKYRHDIATLYLFCGKIGAANPTLPDLYKSLCKYDYKTKKSISLLHRYLSVAEYDSHGVLMVEILLLAGADPNAKCKNKVPLGYVCSFSLTSDVKILIKALLDAGAKVDGEMLRGKKTLLHKFLNECRSNKEEEIIDIVKILLEVGVDLQATDKDGRTPFSLAKKWFYSDRVVKFLIPELAVTKEESEEVETGCFFQAPDSDQPAEVVASVAQCVSTSERVIQPEESRESHCVCEEYSDDCFDAMGEGDKFLTSPHKEESDDQEEEWHDSNQITLTQFTHWFNICKTNEQERKAIVLKLIKDYLPIYSSRRNKNNKYYLDHTLDQKFFYKKNADQVLNALLAKFETRYQKCQNNTSLYLDFCCRDPLLIQLFLLAGASPNCHTLNTPLHRAAGWGDKEVVQLLLLAGADKKAKNGNGQTPSQYATRFFGNKNEDIARLIDERKEL